MARKIELSESEIIDELRSARQNRRPDPPGVFVVSELAEKSGKSTRTIRDQLGHLKRQGRVETFQVSRRGCDGNMRLVPAYRITPEKKARR